MILSKPVPLAPPYRLTTVPFGPMEQAASDHAAQIAELEAKHERAIAVANGEHLKAKAVADAEFRQAITSLKAEADRMLKQLEDERAKAIQELEAETIVRQRASERLNGFAGANRAHTEPRLTCRLIEPELHDLVDPDRGAAADRCQPRCRGYCQSERRHCAAGAGPA